jgi:hypothetical protein
MLLANGLNMEALTGLSGGNPLIAAVVSIVIGAVFGFASGKLAGVLGKG